MYFCYLLKIFSNGLLCLISRIENYLVYMNFLLQAVSYHAGLSDSNRISVQSQWINDKFKVSPYMLVPIFIHILNVFINPPSIFIFLWPPTLLCQVFQGIKFFFIHVTNVNYFKSFT